MNVLLLAIDTTSEAGSIALVDQEGIVEEVPLAAPEGFAHILFPAIQHLLARHTLALESLHGFASASGPGSFTGVRVGLTAVKGLAEATGRKVVAVSNLQALASCGTRPLRAAVIDARRGEVYGAVYDSSLCAVRSEVVTRLLPWLASLPAGDLEFITQGVPAAAFGARGAVAEAPRVIAGAVGRIALQQFLSGNTQDAAEIDANYVRRSDAELLWKDG